MMGDQPWNRSAGKFDVPSSSIPKTREQEKLAAKANRAARKCGSVGSVIVHEDESLSGARAMIVILDEIGGPPPAESASTYKTPVRGKRIR